MSRPDEARPQTTLQPRFPEAASRVDPSRLEFLRRSALFGGAALFATACSDSEIMAPIDSTHAGVDVTNITDVSALSVSEAWDEPLSVSEVLQIVGPFTVQ